MAISKLILNGEVQMDVTSNTNTAANMLNGVVGTKNDGTSVTGNIATKTSSDLTASGATVTAPAGYYANAASKAVSTTTHPNPTAAITSSTGVITASHTQDTGYVTGGTTTDTLNLTTQAGKTVTPTETAQTAVASYRWTTGPVSVAAISSTYVGTGVTTRSAADLTASGSIVTAPAGYYSTAATKSISAGSAFPPAVTITKAPIFSMNSSTGVVTVSYTGSSSITPTVTAGYISQGTSGTISTFGTSTYQLATQAAQTITPTSTVQYINSYQWLTGSQTIAAIPSAYIIPSGTSNITSNGTYDISTYQSASVSVPKTYTATINGNGNSSNCYVQLNNGTKYYTDGDTFQFKEGDTLKCYGYRYASGGTVVINVNSEVVAGGISSSFATYNYTMPAKDIYISLLYQLQGSISIIESVIPYAGYKSGLTITPSTTSKTYYTTNAYFNGNTVVDAIPSSYIIPSGTSTITSNGIYDITSYQSVSVNCSGGGGSGGYTADEIATRAISGAISGSALTINNFAFNNCKSITTATFPSASKIGISAFAYCTSLTSISFPSATNINAFAFFSCTYLTEANFPLVQNMSSYAFSYCTRLSVASFPSLKAIASSAFYSCYNLLSLYLMGSSMVTLSNVSAFYATPISTYTTSTGGVYGSIFVPTSLYNSYITATNWATYSARIVSV